MAFLSTVSTGLATKFALKLFFTPLKFPIPKRELPVRDSAKTHKLNTGKNDFLLFEWEGPGEKVLLVHGWSGRGTQFFKIIEALQSKGFHVFAIEAPGHGGLPHAKTHMLEFVDCIETSQAQFGPFNISIGHSLGGMAIFNALQRNLASNKVITIGSPSCIRNVVDDFCEKVHASKAVAEGIVHSIENRYSIKLKDASTDELAALHNPTGLIIHDKHDQDVPEVNANQLSEKWTNAELMITEGLGHRKVLMDDSVLDKIMNFLS